MLKFIEEVKFDPVFAKTVYKTFFNREKSSFDFNKSCPYSRSIKPIRVTPTSIIFSNVTDRNLRNITLKVNVANKVIWEYGGADSTESSIEVIKCGLLDLKDQGSAMAEDCQASGAALANAPANITRVISLGYKNENLSLANRR